MTSHLRALREVAALTLVALGAIGCSAEPASPSSELSPVAHGLAPMGHVGLRDRALLDALRAEISGHRGVGYKRARQLLLGGMDMHEGEVQCIYTGLTRSAATLNIEHSWPQSLGAGTEPMRSDLHHLFVSTDSANSRRGNYPFGDTECDTTHTCKWSLASSSLGDDAAGERVFEVRPARRGDIARAQFYFATRYAKRIADVTEETLRAWHAGDPVDADESAKNDAVENVQLNRNPFIDEPDLVDRISDF